MIGRKNSILAFSIITLTFSILQIAINLYDTLLVKDFVDFVVYREATLKYLQGLSPYTFLYAVPATIPFNYPPSAIPFLFPLALLPAKAGQIVLSLVSIASLIASLWMMIKLSKVTISLTHFFLLCAFFIQTFPVKFTLILGQMNMVVMLPLIASLYWYNTSGKKWSSIVLFSIAAAIKMLPIYFLPLFLVAGNIPFVVGVSILFWIMNFATSLKLTQEYFLQILPHLSKVDNATFYDQSIYAFIMRLTHNPIAAQITMYSVLLLVLSTVCYAVYKGRVQKRPLIWGFTIMCAIVSINNYFSWQHHLVLTYPLIVLLYTYSWQYFKRIIHYAIFSIVWFLFVFHFKNELHPLVQNPFVVAYQTLTVLLLIGWGMYVLLFKITNQKETNQLDIAQT